MNPNTAPTSPIVLIAWGVYLETIRRKDFYVLAILVGIFALGVTVARFVGIENAATATFLLNLGITFAFLSATILTLLTSARQVPDELDSRTIHPLLAKPITRFEYLAGKWLACTGVGVVSMLALFLVAYLPVPKKDDFDTLLLLQALLLKALSLGMLAALTILTSLMAPKPVTVVLLALLYTVGTTAGNFLKANVLGGPLEQPVGWLVRYIPNFDLLDLTKRFTDGAVAVNGPTFAGLILYALIFTGVALLAACAIFDRKPL